MIQIWREAEYLSVSKWSLSMLWLFMWGWLWWWISVTSLEVLCPQGCGHRWGIWFCSWLIGLQKDYSFQILWILIHQSKNETLDPYSQLTKKIYSGSVTLTLITRDVPTLDVNLHIPPQSVTGSALNRIYSGVGPSILASMHTWSAPIHTVSWQKCTRMDQLRSLLLFTR